MSDRLSSIRQNIQNRSSRPSAPQKRRSRREQEARHQRLFLLSMVSAAVLILLILGGGVVYEYVVKPNAVLAEVNGHEIKRRDYWKYRSIELYNQAQAYQNFAAQSSGDQQTQFYQFAAQFEAEREDVWGSTDVNASTIESMIENQLYADGAEEMGITVSDEQGQTLALNQFAQQPLVTPIPTPTMIPERQATATASAEAAATEQAAMFVTPEATPLAGTPVGGTPQATPVAGTPVATPVASPAATPVATPQATPGGTPVATPGVATPVPSATPNPEDNLKGADANFDIFQDQVFSDAHLSMDDYLRLWVVPNEIKNQVDAQLTANVPQTAPQVNAEHILVGTQELAQSLYDQANGGADFEQLARANSTDTTTAPSGGQLGWFTKLEINPVVADTAFGMQPGQISQPVQSPYGWHVIKVLETDPNRALSDTQYEQEVDTAIDTWVQQQRDAGSVKSDYKPTPTATAAAFEAPASAPTAIPTEPATPIASPVSDQATPGASPVASPIATPGGTPVATPAS